MKISIYNNVVWNWEIDLLEIKIKWRMMYVKIVGVESNSLCSFGAISI
jgi:hypothetical protein